MKRYHFSHPTKCNSLDLHYLSHDLHLTILTLPSIQLAIEAPHALKDQEAEDLENLNRTKFYIMSIKEITKTNRRARKIIQGIFCVYNLPAPK